MQYEALGRADVLSWVGDALLRESGRMRGRQARRRLKIFSTSDRGRRSKVSVRQVSRVVVEPAGQGLFADLQAGRTELATARVAYRRAGRRTVRLRIPCDRSC